MGGWAVIKTQLARGLSYVRSILSCAFHFLQNKLVHFIHYQEIKLVRCSLLFLQFFIERDQLSKNVSFKISLIVGHRVSFFVLILIGAFFSSRNVMMMKQKILTILQTLMCYSFARQARNCVQQLLVES